MNPSVEDRLMGITPILLRRAAYYLGLGEGTYFPDHPHFDKVVVSKLYDFMQNPQDPMEWSVGFVVSFYQKEHKARWVEFGCRTIGAGGDSVLKIMEPL